MITQQTRDLLVALKSSANPRTAQHAAAILLGCSLIGGCLAEDYATTGTLGGFLEAVMTGDLLLVWQLADELNRQEIAHLIPEEIRARY